MPPNGRNISYFIISFHTNIPWDNSKRLGLDKIVDKVSVELLLPLLVLETSPVARIIAYEIPKKDEYESSV